MGVAAGDDIIDACARGAAVAAQCLSHAGSFPMPRP
jgi:sugar/nucleoside kinase (ribokinase family)